MNFPAPRILLSVVTLSSAMLLPVARASTVIDFEGSGLANLYDPAFSDSFSQAGFTLAPRVDFGIVGSAADLNDTAPTGNATQFYFTSNHGSLELTRPDFATFSLQGFSAAYVPQSVNPVSDSRTVLLATGTTKTGKIVVADFAFSSSSSSHFPFRIYSSAADFTGFSSLVSLTFKACSLSGALDCSSTAVLNDGQFALDDIVLASSAQAPLTLAAPVPEPANVCLVLLGLCMLAARFQINRRGVR